MKPVVLVGALMLLAACDPMRSVSGRVRSVPPTRVEGDQAEVRPLSGAVVRVVCGARAGMAFPDPLAGTSIVAISRSDGTFDYGDIGTWSEDCVLHFESGDGSHDRRKLAISDLCRQLTGDDSCLVLRNITVDLVRRREPSPPLELRVRTTPPNLELHTDDSVTCRTPCEVPVTRGLHRFELFESGRSSSLWREQAVVTADTELAVRYESHRSRPLAAGWFLLPLAVGAVMLPIGLKKEDEPLLWTSTGLIVGGGVGFLLVWKSDEVEATVRPLVPAGR